jgi:hypothetical protein
MSSTLETLRQRFENLTVIILDAERELQAGKIISLGSLERDVEQLCKTIKRSEPQTARALQPDMAELIQVLDGLATQLNDLKERMKNE